MDLLVANSTDKENRTDTVSWYRNDGATTPGFVGSDVDASLSFKWMKTTHPAFATDLDADGDVDILVADLEHVKEKYGDTGDGVIYWYENDGAQTFGDTSRREVHRPNTWERGVYALDLDGDGDVDVLAASFSSTLYWYQNDGTETFTPQSVSSNEVYATAVYAADVDGDADMDVLSASASGGRTSDLAWYRNDGTATPSFTKKQILNRGSGRRAVVALDLDGDGDVDVLDASKGANTVSWYENQDAYNWGRDTSTTWVTHVVTASATQAWSVAARDLDGDGDVDVLVASKDDGTVAWYENSGRVGYTPRVDFAQHLIVANSQTACEDKGSTTDAQGYSCPGTTVTPEIAGPTTTRTSRRVLCAALAEGAAPRAGSTAACPSTPPRPTSTTTAPSTSWRPFGTTRASPGTGATA